MNGIQKWQSVIWLFIGFQNETYVKSEINYTGRS